MNDEYIPSGIVSAGTIELQDIPLSQEAGYSQSGLISAGTITLVNETGGSGHVYAISGLVSAGSIALVDPILAKFWHRRSGEKRPFVLKRESGGGNPEPEDNVAVWRRTLVPGEFFPNETNTGIYWDESDPRFTVIQGVKTGSGGGSFNDIMTYATPNAVIENTLFKNISVKVKAANVHFRNCLFEGGDRTTIVDISDTSVNNFVLEDCTIRSSSNESGRKIDGVNGVYGWNMKLVRCNFYHLNDAVGIYPPPSGLGPTANAELEGIWVHDSVMTNMPVGGNRFDGMVHPDCIHWRSGSGFKVNGCRLEPRPDPTLGVAQDDPVWEETSPGSGVIKMYGSDKVVLTGNRYREKDENGDFVMQQYIWGSSVVMTSNSVSYYYGIPEFRNSWIGGGAGAGLNLSPGGYAQVTYNGNSTVAMPAFVIENCWIANNSSDWIHGNSASGVNRRWQKDAITGQWSYLQTGDLINCHAYNINNPWDISVVHTASAKG